MTLQYYKSTSNGVLDEQVMREIFEQLKESRKFASGIGSLVVSESDRPTEFLQVKAEPWWYGWWNLNGFKYPHLDEKKARDKIFKNGRFEGMSLSRVEHRLDKILSPKSPNSVPFPVQEKGFNFF